jgi:uncharacterized repeat protein (TIGR02543 family)
MALDLSNIKSIVGLSGKTIKEVRAKSGKVLWKAGAIVTYVVDVGVTKYEEVDTGDSCLTPTTFTPSKSGWTFVGWRKDTTASATVEPSVVMEGEPITLYAVFSKDVCLTFYDGSGASGVNRKAKYYNNGDALYPSFTLGQSSIDGWSRRGWGTSTSADASVVYAKEGKHEFESDTTIYGLYEKTISLTVFANGEQPPLSYKAYHNSYGNTDYPEFTVSNPSKSGATFLGWSTANDTTVEHTSISNMELTANTTLYAVYKYNDATLKTGWSQYLYVYGEPTIIVLSGIDGTKYASVTADVQAIGLRCGA